MIYYLFKFLVVVLSEVLHRLSHFQIILLLRVTAFTQRNPFLRQQLISILTHRRWFVELLLLLIWLDILRQKLIDHVYS